MSLLHEVDQHMSLDEVTVMRLADPRAANCTPNDGRVVLPPLEVWQRRGPLARRALTLKRRKICKLAQSDGGGNALAEARANFRDDAVGAKASHSHLNGPEGSETVDEERPLGTGRKRMVTRLVVGLVALGILGALAVGWQWTALTEWVDVGQLLSRLSALRGSPVATLVVIASYPFGGLVMFPVTLLILTTVAVFGPLLGFVAAIAGCLLTASL